MAQLATQSGPETKQEAILRASNIRKTFRMGDSEVQVLKGADLSVKPGEFVAIERHPPTVGLHHGQFAQLHALDGGEALAAIAAEAPPADRAVILGGTAVLHLGVVETAERAAHGGLPNGVEREASAEFLDPGADRLFDRGVGAVIGSAQTFQDLIDHQANVAEFLGAEAPCRAGR